jgi:hypothetical protein
MTLKTQIQNFSEKLERLENALRLALTSPTKQFTQEAIEDILKGKGQLKSCQNNAWLKIKPLIFLLFMF